ncbi:MAG: DsrH/TusB family sulfur relay protein [Nitrospirota bacterium]
MLVIVKSAPDTSDGKRGIQMAKDMAADIVLLQNSVYSACKERLNGFPGTVYVLSEDMRLRGIKGGEIGENVKALSYDDLVDLMATEDNVVGMF